jgi:hypothetical protein
MPTTRARLNTNYIDEQSTTSNASTADSKRQRLPAHVQKLLAEDIEANGGISKLKGSSQALALLLDRKQGADNPYGRRGDHIRQRLQQKVCKWQQLQKQGKYSDEVLNTLGVTSFANQTKNIQKEL